MRVCHWCVSVTIVCECISHWHGYVRGWEGISHIPSIVLASRISLLHQFCPQVTTSAALYCFKIFMDTTHECGVLYYMHVGMKNNHPKTYSNNNNNTRIKAAN